MELLGRLHLMVDIASYEDPDSSPELSSLQLAGPHLDQRCSTLALDPSTVARAPASPMGLALILSLIQILPPASG